MHLNTLLQIQQPYFTMALHYFRTTILLLIITILPAAAADDIALLVEKKGDGARQIVTEPTIFRESKARLPVSARQYEHLVDRPRTARALARLYAPQLDPYDVTVRSDGIIHLQDQAGLAGDAEIIDARPGRRAFLVTGHFEILKMRFHGHMVMMTEYAELPDGAGGLSVDATTRGYVKVKSAFVGMFARLADYLFPKKVDERINRFLKAAESVAVAVHRDPADARKKLEAAGELTAEEIQEFAQVF